jgi:3-phytase
LNGAAGIDGASETDGLEVTSANLGGPWSDGMLVVQDGRKRMPEQTQNFKFVPWNEVAKALRLP